jgi:alpha-amylase
VVLLSVANSALAQSPAELNGVMLQAFYWDVPQSTPAGSWWKNLEQKADEFADAGFTGIWLPPPHKGAAGGVDVGYGVYDRYDLGEFNQKGGVATRYGTRNELESAIAALKARHLQVYADIVMNHMMGADRDDEFDYAGQHFKVPTKFLFPGRGTTYSNYTWQFYNFNGVQRGDQSWQNWKGGWDFLPYPDAWDNLMGCEIRYLDPNNRDEMIRWGKWLTSTLHLDGYRLDATRHIHTPFINQWLDEVKQTRFAVSEAAFYQVDELRDYANRTGRRTSLFDFPLHKVFAETLNPNGSGDLRRLRFAGFTEVDGVLSVPFVDNHDTDGSFPVVNQKLLAYAYMLVRDKGYPCVFYKDYYNYGLGSAIKKLIEIRRDHAHGPGWEHDESDEDVYVYSRAGDAQHPGLLLILCDQDAPSKQIRTPFRSARLRDVTGNQAGDVLTDGQGIGAFPVKGASYSIWCPVTTADQPIAGGLSAPAPANAAQPPVAPPDPRRPLISSQDPFSETVSRIVYVNQNWTPNESHQFHYLPQGSQIIPYDWFMALEQVDSTTPFHDNQNMLLYRYLPQSPGPLNPDGLPIGFVRDQGNGRAWLGLTCAACHTTEIHYNNVAYVIDGAPTHGDVEAFLSGMIASMQQTQQDTAKFSRFATRVLYGHNSPDSQARLRAQLAASIQTRIGYNLRNFPGYDPSRISPPPGPHSFGRLDAVDAIVNEVYHLAIRNPNPANPTEEAQPANAPVSYPFLWDTPRHDKVEWLGIAESGGLADIFSLSRNVGEVIGVFGDVQIPNDPSLLSLGYRSSVKIDRLRELEDLVKTLWSPQWPPQFPAVLEAERQAGEQLYRQQCISCHAVMKRDDPNRVPHEVILDAKTDPQAATNFFSRTGSSGKLNGLNVNFVPFAAKISDPAPAQQMLTNVVLGTILGGLKDPPPDQLNELRFGPAQGGVLAAAAPTAAYKARPLNGIWATAPYLHNGSVPNLDALLRPVAARPKTFSVGSRRFDPVRVGYDTDAPGFPKFQVNDSHGNPIRGNYNGGHEWGAQLNDSDRQKLINYLKTL